MDPNSKLYNELRTAYRDAHPKKPYGQMDKEVGKIWKELRAQKEAFPANVKPAISEWKKKSDSKRKTLTSFFESLPKQPKIGSNDIQLIEPTTPKEQENGSQIIGADESRDHKTDQNLRHYPRPVEEKLNREILALNQDISHLKTKMMTGLATSEQQEELKLKQSNLSKVNKKLRELKGNRERQQHKRERQKKFFQENPDLAAKLGRRETIGRPPIEADHPELLKAIIDIASFGAPADDRRRSEALRSIKTLDELTTELQRNFQISRSAVYLRLLPRRGNSLEGKRHHTTVPVRLNRAFNDGHKSHADAMFCRATISYLDEVASIMGSNQVLYISQDDKARVPIGLTAAKKQAPMLMHLDYRVILPDHDWVVAERHKLIPSVYGIMTVKDNMMGDLRAVTYSGPTFIAIRSGKHCSSTASSHGKDFDTLVSDEEFFGYTRCETGDVKPIVIVVADGGPDENPRFQKYNMYEKVINEAIQTFQKYNLDGLFVATNAPGRSAFNRVERRMAPLSRDLCGVILEHDYFGSHLDEQGRTIDPELESQNFEQAGETLAEIWSSSKIDGHRVKAEYVKPEFCNRQDSETESVTWKGRHVREGHYFLQIVKCDDESCCGRKRSTFRNTFNRFVPAPLRVDQKTLTVGNDSELGEYSSLLLRMRLDDGQFRNPFSGEVPFDIACPSVSELIPSRTCGRCGLYFASVKSVKAHKRQCVVGHSALNASEFGTPILELRRNRRPVRLAARRQQERMVIWSSRLNDQHVDWFDEEELNNVDIDDTTESSNNDHVSIIDIATHQAVPWESVE